MREYVENALLTGTSLAFLGSNANDTVYGLGAHVQGRDMDVVRNVASRIRAGQVHLNYPAWDPHAPFGGFKQSGNGREYGLEGMREYLEVKSILGYL